MVIHSYYYKYFIIFLLTYHSLSGIIISETNKNIKSRRK
nr:MAG TPA: hypothetical protein [Caudoviricetes sp.]